MSGNQPVRPGIGKKSMDCRKPNQANDLLKSIQGYRQEYGISDS
jgi:hypothetical protein